MTDVFDDGSPRVTTESGEVDSRSPDEVIGVGLAAGGAAGSARGAAPAGCLGTCDQPGPVSGAEPSSGSCPCSGSGARAARRLAELAALRLIDAPAAAEEQLRRALVVGGGELRGRELAVLHTQLVTAVAAQPGRDRDVARAAATAAECWRPISAADSVHLRLVAGRAWHRAGRHAEAVAALDLPLLNAETGYPPRELAQVRAEFAESLIRLGRYRQAAWQFTEAARLLAGSSTDRHRHADLVWSAAVTRECCGQEAEALGGYLCAADLWGDQDKIVPRSQCLRAAAWLQLRGESNRVRGQWWVTVEALLAELDRCVTADPAAHLVEELERTRSQYTQMCEQATDVDEREGAPLYADPLVWWESH
ncbi:hypothetical protein [Nocardia mangyaensis]|uniref:hypothetical protein n=1 Tax=Nocardia mangyaensis TaxID=2213200 RepID=UPI0026744305|nr:hypothetical protein [Nocardia mangyaensis]MDO3649620.1 hypothetical protein [Nocardia mangyaensis]